MMIFGPHQCWGIEYSVKERVNFQEMMERFHNDRCIYAESSNMNTLRMISFLVLTRLNLMNI